MLVRDVGKTLNISRPAISRAFDALNNAKLLKRERGENDRRDVYGYLTSKGIELAKGL
jgi:DNA-binding MarR family transcriptional regulator